MTNDLHDDAWVIAHLNDLLQLDHDAVEAYTVALDLARDPRIRDALVMYRGDHKRHIEEIGELVRLRGGMAIDLPHPTAPLKLAVQSLGALASDEMLLLAFKSVEGQVVNRYRRAAAESWPSDVMAIVTAAYGDEQTHYRWAERALTERGVGEGTLPHSLASVLETVNKVLADPVETAERTIMEQVGRVARSRTGDGETTTPP